ncbi:MAG: AAA family ATPase [Rickettsiales bacterium]|jgi:two-component system response regulator FlrC|nr:AAA family ATPase [Rickettsiales bacterium]
MVNFVIIDDDFNQVEINKLINFFEKREILFKNISKNEFNIKDYPKSILICSGNFLNNIGGKDSLVKIARKLSSSKILILHSGVNDYSMSSELGGSYLNISYPELDDCIKELVININSKQKFSFSDPKTTALIRLAKRVAETDVTVFVHGPTGTGKEVISNFIHKESKRSNNPFIALNCAAIPENMLEAMLFGHEKGAFTGASSANKGIFRAADTGTLLLDEISEMPLSLQAKLLRVLQEKKVTPIGGQRDIDVDVRVIATTNRDMVEEVKNKKFREDLYYRLNVFPIETTNLSERPGDIIPISIALLKRHITKDQTIPFLSKDAQKILTNYSWPGNVRELENVLQRAIVLSNKKIINDKDIMIDSVLFKKNIVQDSNLSNKKALNL